MRGRAVPGTEAAEADRMFVGVARNECSTAFGDLYERCHKRILRLALRITRNLQDAEDVTQECFLQAFVHLDSFSGKSKLWAWISRIAINAALMKIRKRRRYEFSIDEPFEAVSREGFVEIECDDPAPDQQLLQRELVQIVTEGMSQLSPSLLSVVNLHYFEELSGRECAQALGISLSSAKSRIFRARLRLRPAFDKRFRRLTVPSRLR